jgi:hypothetical protein
VAGKIGGKRHGIAKGANLHAVKILDKSGMGTTSVLVQGKKTKEGKSMQRSLLFFNTVFQPFHISSM